MTNAAGHFKMERVCAAGEEWAGINAKMRQKAYCGYYVIIATRHKLLGHKNKENITCEFISGNYSNA